MKFKVGDEVRVVALDPDLAAGPAEPYLNKNGIVREVDDEYDVICVNFKGGNECSFSEKELAFSYKYDNIKVINKFLGVKDNE